MQAFWETMLQTIKKTRPEAIFDNHIILPKGLFKYNLQERFKILREIAIMNKNLTNFEKELMPLTTPEKLSLLLPD